MKLFKGLLAVIIIIVGILGFKFLITHKKVIPKKPVKILPPIVNVIQIKKFSQNIEITATGTVYPIKTTFIQPEVSGKVVWVSKNFQNGKIVKKGELLVKLDNFDYKIALTKANAFYKKTLLEIEQIKEKAKTALEEWEKAKKRLNLQKPAPLRLFKPQLENAKAQLKLAKAEIELAKKNIERTSLRAPFNGIITEKKGIDIGAILAKGTIVSKLLSTDSVEIITPIPDYDYPFIDFQNQNVTISLKLKENGYKFKGILDRSSGMIKNDTRMINIISIVYSPYNLKIYKVPLFIGSFVEAHFKGKLFKNIAKIPAIALHGENQVWIAKNNRLYIKKVKIIKLQKDSAFVTGNFNNNDLLIISNLPYVSNGMKIRYKIRQ